MSSIANKLSNFLSKPNSRKSKSDTPKYHPPVGPPPQFKEKSSGNFTPPPGPPPGLPRLVEFPFLTKEQIPTLYSQGYARVHLAADHPLLIAANRLFSASHDFFAQPLEHKEQFNLSKIQEKKGQSSEEGWSRVEGEKEMLTVRRTKPLCPPEMIDDTKTLWSECGSFMQIMMHSIEESLGLKKGTFDSVVKDECILPAETRHETLLRMFRYERAEEPRLVAAHHRDIGLLSLVIGSSPGLDVWDERTKSWVAIEEEGPQDSGLTLTFLAGQTLTRLTNNRYKPGMHRVFVPQADATSSSGSDEAKYRYSLVYALRPFREAILSTSSYTSEVTGDFEYPFENVKAQTLFNAIADAHWSVNGAVEEREAQQKRLQKMKEKAEREQGKLR